VTPVRSTVGAVLAGADVSRSGGAVRVRRGLAALFVLYALLLAGLSIGHGSAPTIGQLVLLLVGVSLLGDFSARFIRDWGLVVAGFFAYGLSAEYAHRLELPTYYAPQIDAERLLFFGSVPTVWLQDRLYNGTTGPLELFAIAMYASHLAVPLLLGVYLWLRRLNHAFFELACALITTSVLASIVFVLAPTAPPWLAAETGYIEPVHHILRLGLLDMGLTSFGEMIGNSSRYNVVAAFPSLHAAFPLVSLAVAIRAGLPRWLIAVLAAQCVAVSFSIVYTGDHYVVDILAGGVAAAAGVFLVRRLLGSVAEATA
jgi:membrane-associated phospholipid phosphatase